MAGRLAAAAAVAALLAGCGSAAAAGPPAARALAAKLGCGVQGQGQNLAAYDTSADISLSGGSPVCLGGEIWTFPSAKAQSDWLHQVQAADGQQPGGLYNWLVVGNLWAVYPGAIAGDQQVARVLGGREVTF